MRQQQSIGREKAIKLAESGWWKSVSFRDRAEFQMLTVELCMPFEVFHEAITKALNRDVWTHEFGMNFDGLIAELFDGKPAPSFEEIINLIPEEKRIIITC